VKALKHILTLLVFVLLLHQGRAQENLFNRLGRNDGLLSNEVYDVITDSQGNLWFATARGVSQLRGFEFRHFSSTQYFNKQLITGFHLSGKGELWCSSANGELFRFDGSVFQGIAMNNTLRKEVSSFLINDLVVDAEDNIWISTIIGGKLFRLNSKLKKLEVQEQFQNRGFYVLEVPGRKYISGPSRGAGEGAVSLSIKLEDKDLSIPLSGRLDASKCHFLTLQDGSHLFATGSEIVRFNDNVIESRLFLEKNLQAIHEDSEGKLWLGLDQGGLVCFPTGDIASGIRIDYLGNKSITSIFEDGNGVVWFGTFNDGLYYISLIPVPKYQSPVISDAGDSGTPHQSIQVELSKTDEKTRTLAVLDTTPPSVFITGVSINNVDTNVLEGYELTADQNFIRLSFAGQSQGQQRLFQYRYRLKGVDKDWVYTSSNNAQYTMLPPGDYTFEVDAMNKAGIWSESRASIGVNIAPFFYQTLWFRILMVALVLLVLGSAVWMYTRRVGKKAKMEAEVSRRIADLELKALRAQMNPHFIFNTLSSIQHYVSSNNTEEALRYLSKFSKLMRQILDNSKKKEITLQDELKAVQLYLELEKLRFKDKFEYEINVDDSIDPTDDQIPSMLIQPYLENSILHGIMHKKGTGHIRLGIERQNGHMLCTIEDDGIGRLKSSEIRSAKSANHKSSGMSISHDRLEIINKVNESELNISIEDANPSDTDNPGTRVRLYIPVNDI
jgi:two-component sensor histidine kinase